MWALSVSQWLIIIRLMYLILTTLLLTQPLPLALNGPNFSAKLPEPQALVLRSDFGLPIAKTKKTRFEKLAAALSSAQGR